MILLRHSHKPNGNTWGLPSGKVEPGETDQHAALRELYEETGYRATAQELEQLGEHEFSGSDSSYTFVTYRVKLNNPYDVQLEMAAHSKYEWVTAEECYEKTDLIPDFHELLRIIGYIK